MSENHSSSDPSQSNLSQTTSSQVDPAQITVEGESYLDIVWRQFKKNKAALISLWMLAPMFLLAIFAPAISSNQPFVFYDGDQVSYPWFRALFNDEEVVDFVFNMVLVGFIPWVIFAIATNVMEKAKHIPGRKRLGKVVLQFLFITGVLCIFFSQVVQEQLAEFGIPKLRPDNSFRSRTFTVEEFQDPENKHGIYTLIPFGHYEQDRDALFKPPGFCKPKKDWRDTNDGFIHLLGTDHTGRDVLTLMLFGSRLALTVGFVAVSIYMTIGIILGALAGYFGGVIDMLISRFIEIMLLFPAFFLILTLVGLIGPSIYIIMVVIGLTGWPTIARLIRGEVLKQRAIDYVSASRSLGASHLRVIFRHILPNALSPALVAAPFGVASAILTEAGLSLLGFGVRPPAPSWGTLLNFGNGNYSYYWLIIVPSLAIFVCVTIFNLVGSGLRDAMDPKLRA